MRSAGPGSAERKAWSLPEQIRKTIYDRKTVLSQAKFHASK
jgi:hypothetical protein